MAGLTVSVAFLYGDLRENDRFTSSFVLFLTILSVLSCSPVSFFTKKLAFPEQVAAAVQAAVFRIFCLIQFDMIQRHRNAPQIALFMALLLFFTAYAGFDTLASSNRWMAVNKRTVVTPPDEIFWFDIAYSVVAIFFGIIAVLRVDESSQRKLVVFVVMVLADLAARWGELHPGGRLGFQLCRLSFMWWFQ
jgi:hypothetical protein